MRSVIIAIALVLSVPALADEAEDLGGAYAVCLRHKPAGKVGDNIFRHGFESCARIAREFESRQKDIEAAAQQAQIDQDDKALIAKALKNLGSMPKR